MNEAVPRHNAASGAIAEAIDDLATQLILRDSPALSPEDLAALSETAGREGRLDIAAYAAALAGQMLPDSAPDSIATDDHQAYQWIEQLRAMLTPGSQAGPGEAATSASSSLIAFAADPAMIAEFITESREHLVAMEEKMLLIEKDTSDMESINAVFRAAHSIKGLAGFLELGSIQEITHEVETLLDLARNRDLTLAPPVVDAIFEGMDFIRFEIHRMEQRLDQTTAAPARDNEALIRTLRAAANGTAPSRKLTLSSSPQAGPSGTRGSPATGLTLNEDRRNSESAFVRVETARLDHLMNMVGELVIAETLVSRNPHVASIKDSRFIDDLALLTRVSAEVHRVTTGMRMVPIGSQFQKIARLVRDLSRQLGKQIVFETAGDETELDKTIADALSDPFLHMVRNAIDHGIETPEERRLAGKDPIARIRVTACHRSGQIVIEISDDGRGLNRDKILARAIERGLVSSAEHLSEAQIFLLIFEPGFSTAEHVTGISGRGVGMDVVKQQMQKLRGRIEIESKASIGTTFFLKLPLTLAIIEGLVLAVGDNHYVLPLYSVIEVFRPAESQLSELDGAEAVALRGSLVAIVRLHERFDVIPQSHTVTDGVLILTESHGRPFCLFVDAVVGQQEIVIKSLDEEHRNIPGVAGYAILADRRVGLILDVDGIVTADSSHGDR